MTTKPFTSPNLSAHTATPATPAATLHEPPLTDARTDAQTQANVPQPDARRLAFADPEFLLRRETRGIRFQLELLKPDLGQQAHGIENTIVVFGSARFKSHDECQALLAAAQIVADTSGDNVALQHAQTLARNAPYYEAARAFAGLVARYSESKSAADRLFICTGGGPGIMQAANRGAHEAGAQSVGLAIALPHEEAANPYVTPALSFTFHYFAARKMHFMMRAKALLAFPGGFGTLDELFEIITLVQTKKSAQVPIVLFGSAYWKRLVNWEVLVEEGVISPGDLQLMHFVDTPQQAWDMVRDFYGLV